eukprot:g829.t1
MAWAWIAAGCLNEMDTSTSAATPFFESVRRFLSAIMRRMRLAEAEHASVDRSGRLGNSVTGKFHLSLMFCLHLLGRHWLGKDRQCLRRRHSQRRTLANRRPAKHFFFCCRTRRACEIWGRLPRRGAMLALGAGRARLRLEPPPHLGLGEAWPQMRLHLQGAPSSVAALASQQLQPLQELHPQWQQGQPGDLSDPKEVERERRERESLTSGLYLIVFDLSLWLDAENDDRLAEESLTFWICSATWQWRLGRLEKLLRRGLAVERKGSLIFFDEEKLKDFVVLDPYWLAEAAANIFNCPRVVQGSVALARRLLERGELHVELLKQHLWRSTRFSEHIPTLINLLLRFDLLDVYVVPFLLPLRSGAYEPPNEGSLSFDFHGMLSRLLPTVFPRLIASAAKTPSLRLTHSQVFKDSCTIFLGRRRICFELLPPVRPEMIAVRRLDRGEEEDDNGELPLDLAKQVINLVHEPWKPKRPIAAGAADSRDSAICQRASAIFAGRGEENGSYPDPRSKRLHAVLGEALCEQEYRVEIDVRLGLSSTLLELLAHGDRAYPGAPVFLHCAMHAGYAASTHGLEPFLLLEDETFTKAFYRSLAAGRQVFSAFEFAQESVAFSPQAGLRPEAQKFVLLPRQEDVLKYPGLSVAPMVRHYSATLQLLTGHAIDESKELGNTSKAMKWMGAESSTVLPGDRVEMARHLSRSDRARVVNVWGKAPGLGKTAMLAEFTRFCIYPGRLFEGLAIWVPLRFAPPEPTPGLLPLVRASSGPRSERGDLFLEQVMTSVILGGLLGFGDVPFQREAFRRSESMSKAPSVD